MVIQSNISERPCTVSHIFRICESDKILSLEKTKWFLRVCLFGILICCKIDTSAQEIKVIDFHADPRDISARENAVYDANGDACALIKVRSGLQGLEFTGDLEIRKVENHEGEYWLWVSPESRQISISVAEIGNLKYVLPSSAQEFNVYVILLTAILPDKVVFKDINSVSISTNPSKAEILINEKFMGFSPMNLNIPDDTFHYEIRKRKYIPASGSYEYSLIKNNLSVSLQKNNNANWFFLGFYGCGGIKYGTSFGLTAGMLGKTGWYISCVPPVRAKETITTTEETITTLYFNIDAPDGYYFRLKETDNTFCNHFRIKAGITHNVFKNAYLKAGLGFSSFRKYYRLNLIPYSNDPTKEIPLKKIVYGRSDYLYNNSGLVIEAGLSYNISKHYILDLNFSSTGFTSAEEQIINTFSDFIFPVETSFGLAYRFN